MFTLIFWVLSYCLVTALSIALLGDRSLISGNLFSVEAILRLIIHWKFVFSMLLAVAARVAFVMVNNTLLGISPLAKNSTTITSLILASAYIFVIGLNALMLKERLSPGQGFGAFLITAGIVFICR